MSIEIIQTYETLNTKYTLYKEDGKEYWHAYFKPDNHPVNKKYFRMSGAEPRDENVQ